MPAHSFTRECNSDVQEMARRYREAQEQYAAGHSVVSFVHDLEEADTCLVREAPPNP